MNAGIFGPYKEHSEVVEQIQKLKEQGYKDTDIIIIADTEERLIEEKKDKLPFETLEEKHTFLQKIKAAVFLKSAKEVDLEGVQQLLDVTDEEAEMYYKQLKEGKIFIFISPEHFLIFDDLSDEDPYDENFNGIPKVRINTEGL
ncbi:MAG: general stress protein [Bacillus sp. (in: firmicutes)]